MRERRVRCETCGWVARDTRRWPVCGPSACHAHEKLRRADDELVSQRIGLEEIDPVEQRRLIVAAAGAAAADDAVEEKYRSGMSTVDKRRPQHQGGKRIIFRGGSVFSIDGRNQPFSLFGFVCDEFPIKSCLDARVRWVAY